MSRVERKRLEREAKRRKRRSLFGIRKDKYSDKNNIEKNGSDIKAIDEISSNGRNTEEMSSKVDNHRKSIVNVKKEMDSIFSEELDKDIDFSKNFSMESFENGDTMIAKPQKMKTADKIISLEDEKMYFERKQRMKNQGFIEDEKILTVNDIHTAEEEGKDIQQTIKETYEKELKKEKNINEIKKIKIEEAPFTDVVKVAESRLEAEKERKEELRREKELERNKEKQKKIETIKENEVKTLEENKKNLDGKKDLTDKDSTNTSNSDVNAESISEKAESEKERKERLLREQIKREQEEKLAELKAESESSKEEISENDSKKESEKENSTSEKLVDNLDNEELEEYSSEDGSEEELGGGFKRFLVKFLKALIVVLIIIYAIGCVIFHNRFFFNTKINGIDAALKTPEQIDYLAAKKVEGYKIVIHGRNNVTDQLLGSDVDMKYIKDGSAKRIKEEQGFLGWPISLFDSEDINGKLNVNINQSKLEEKVKNFNIFKNENIKEPVSAFPRYDEKKKDIVIDKGDVGSTPLKSKTIAFVGHSVRSEVLNEKYPDKVYKSQKNKADDPRIPKAIEIMKKYTGVSIEYDFGYEKYVVGAKDISKMFDINSEGDYSVKFDIEKVRDFVRSLSRKYSTYGDTREIQSASTGGKLKVSGGVYGWLINRDGETEELAKLIKEGKNVKNRTPLYTQTAISRDKNDMGNEFIEIDLSKQYMWFVRDGKVIVETPIVSGNPNRGDATPPGIYPISYKTRNAVLRGPGYASPVSYWIPFNGNIGIHDASWQPVYGGSRYLYAGSHGCINTPYSKVAEIYKLAKDGMPVVVHY